MAEPRNSRAPNQPPVDPLIHAPARLAIMATLAAVEEADFRYLQRATGLTKGNLSAHLAKLADAGYVHITKTFRGKYPWTLYRLTPQGRAAFEAYRRAMLEYLRRAGQAPSAPGPPSNAPEPEA
ncbi:MAG: transcriptional regulator [Chloroflexi bacterium]|nr:transcriptional regulator [Chloroflexota bacterium]